MAAAAAFTGGACRRADRSVIERGFHTINEISFRHEFAWLESSIVPKAKLSPRRTQVLGKEATGIGGLDEIMLMRVIRGAQPRVM